MLSGYLIRVSSLTVAAKKKKFILMENGEPKVGGFISLNQQVCWMVSVVFRCRRIVHYNLITKSARVAALLFL